MIILLAGLVSGMIVGLLVALLVLIITKRFNAQIDTFVEKISTKAQGEGYIIGLTDEEQSFADSLKKKEETGEVLS